MKKIKDRDRRTIVFWFYNLPFVYRLKILLKLNLIKNEDSRNDQAWEEIDFIFKRVEENCCMQEFIDEINNYYETIELNE